MMKSVSINEDKNQIQVFTIDDECDNDELWFSVDDFHDMKMKYRAAAREWRKMGYSTLLKETFMMPKSNAQEYIDAFAQLDGDKNQRGLERHCNKRHGEERSECKERARNAVFETQYKFSREGDLKGDVLTHRISTAYINAAREAKLFARRLGKADEMAVKIQEEDGGEENFIIQACLQQKMQRRASNVSQYSVNSYDSQSHQQSRLRIAMRQAVIVPKAIHHKTSTTSNTKCPPSPTNPQEELYAAIA